MSPGVGSYALASGPGAPGRPARGGAGVDVGGGPLLRRLGLRRLARRFSSRSLPWSELYAASPAAHTVQLRVDRERVAGLGPAGLAQVMAGCPPHMEETCCVRSARGWRQTRSAEHIPRSEAASWASLALEAAPIVERMAPDDAAAALRHTEAEDRHAVLEGMATHRAGELRASSCRTRPRLRAH